MKLTSESKFLLGILVATVTIVGGAMVFLSRESETPVISKKVLIPSSGAHAKGNPDAPVYLVEFSDYQCPACAAFEPIVRKITDTYNDDLLFVYRHYPLPKHQYAKAAAYAAEAAGRQDKFWEATHMLFANQDKFSDAYWGTLAQNLGLRMETFKIDSNAQEVKDVIERDLSQAQELNIRATPTFFLNGKALKLFAPEDLEKAVRQAIEK